jgi:hypothetical protein
LKDEIQRQYEARLGGYAGLIHGNTPPGLAAKLATYTAFLDQFGKHGDDLWRIEPLLPLVINAVEVDLHLAMARLLEPPNRSDRSLFRFLKYCVDNRNLISWRSGSPPEAVLKAQLTALGAHQVAIDAIKARRDKFFAHLDKEYFLAPSKVYDDYPVEASEVIALANCMIDIVAEHQDRLSGEVNFHLAQFYTISVDNMVRNALVGRKANFPGQVDDL